MTTPRPIPPLFRTASIAVAAVWLAMVYLLLARSARPLWLATEVLAAAQGLVFLIAAVLGVIAIRWSRPDPSLRRAWIASLAYVPIWVLLVFLADIVALDTLRVYLVYGGQGGLFVIGLGWLVWYLEQSSRAIEVARYDAAVAEVGLEQAIINPAAIRLRRGPRCWNPFDPAAWYYAGGNPKLNQSLTAFVGYSIVFMLLVLLLGSLNGCQELYELPAGGGQQQAIAQKMQIQKVIKKKFVINPFSSIVWNPPPIEEVRLQLEELSEHQYTVGYGQGDGAGYAGGTRRGKVRFIRLEYSGGDWNQDFGVGADLNMLIQYGVRTGQKVENQTESRTIAQLKNFPLGASPAFVYMTGEKSISLSKSEIETLRDYLLTKHGMLFGDNGGSRHFHNQFLSMMNAVLPSVRPVPIPLDDRIHRIPYRIPFLPYVAPHGGKEALGWKVDGRWVAYYHPGDIADAWADGHAGVSPEVYEYCYQLGVNVINYANYEYSKWLESRQK